MAKLTGTGAPTRTTIGALGDIYTDTNTGIQYECTFAYRDDTDADFDCQWRELPNTGKKPQPVKQEKKEEPKLVEPEMPETKEETPVKQPQQKRTDYTSFGKNKGHK